MEKIISQLNGLAEYFEKLAENTTLDDAETYNCPICRDCGYIIENGCARPCICQPANTGGKSLDIPHLQKMRFANFDVRLYPDHIRTERGKSYRQLAKEALVAAMAFTQSIIKGQNRPGLIFEGDVGSGKTFLAAAIANELLDNGIDIDFVVVPEFLDELRHNIHSNDDCGDDMIARARNTRVLILDDMGAHNFSPWVQNILFTIINYRLNHELTIIITTNLSISEMIDAVGERITSRMMETGTNIKLFTDSDIRLKLFKDGRNNW